MYEVISALFPLFFFFFFNVSGINSFIGLPDMEKINKSIRHQN